MRFKFTVFLLALNVITFGLIAYLNRESNRAEPMTGGLSGQIGRELIDADRIELHGRGLESPRVLERRGSTWQLTEPMQWSANYFAINRILNQLQFLEEDASFPVDEIAKTGQSLADYGLADPLLKLTIAEGEQSFSLSIGTLTEIGNNVYLLGPGGREIFVVDRQVIDGLLVDLNDLRTREIFDIPVFEVDALGLQIRSDSADSGFLKVRLARSNGTWSFEAPLAVKADPALVDNTVNTLTAAKVGRFVEASEASVPLGLDSPFMQVTIHGNQRRQTLIIGNLDPQAPGAPHYFAKLESNPAIFTVLARPFDALREAQEALRDRKFIHFDPARISAINIAENGRKIRLQKLETGEQDWQVLESKGENEIQPHRADPAVMARLIEDLETLRASGFAVDAPSPSDLERLGFNQPRRVVTLNFSEGAPLSLILAHPEDENDALYAKTDQADYIYLVERRPTLRMLPLNTLHYRKRTLETLPAAARISELKLTRLPSGESILDLSLPKDETDWNGYLQAQYPEQADDIRPLLEAVREFRVKNYLLDRFEADAYPVDVEKTLPWVYRLSATITLPGGETDRTETQHYVFTERLSGTVQVGGSERHDVIFEIPQPLLDALHELSDEMELPPEAREAPVPDPAPVEPVPEPEPIPAAEG